MPQGTVQICLFDLGTFQTTDNIIIYSNVDNFEEPILGTDIPISLLTPPNCPFLINVPEDTTTLYLTNEDVSSCVFIDITSSNLCEFCEFGFSEFSAQTIGRIIVGVLTATCQNVLTDYVIGWYNEENELVLTSGEGELFSYEYSQPALGTSSPFVPPGTYTPIILQIALNGQTFDLGINSIPFSGNVSDNYVWATVDCLPEIEVIVDSFRCAVPVNPDTPLTGYSHNVAFIGAASDAPSIPEFMPVHLILDENTTHVAYAFRGVAVVDQIKVVYSGVNYDQPFILDWFTVGSDNPNNNFTQFPIQIDLLTDTPSNQSYLKKVLCLTGFTNINYELDQIIFEIIPNQSNTNTDWYLSFECFDSFDCDSCILTANTKVNLQELQFLFQFPPCGTRVQIQNKISGCTEQEVQTDYIYNYFQRSYMSLLNPPNTYNYYSYGIQNKIPPFPNQTLLASTNSGFMSFSGSAQGNLLDSALQSCASATTDTITFSKTYNSGNGLANIYMTFETLGVFNTYYNSYFLARSSFNPNYSDDQEETFYEYFRLSIPFDNNPETPCGDQSVPKEYYIPKNVYVTTGQTQSGTYILEMSWSGISNNLPITNCFRQVVQSKITQLNSTLINNSTITTNVGSRYSDPFGAYGYNLIPGITATTEYFAFAIHRQLFETVPRNYNNTSILYPQFSGVTCPNIYNLYSQNNIYYKSYATFRFTLLDEENITSHKVEKYIDNTGWVPVYTFSGDPGNFYDVDYNYAY